MSRLARRRLLTITAAALAVLVAPAAANAASYTVAAGGGPCGGADLACGDLAEAAKIAAAGDTFAVAAGSYPAAKFTVGGITITGGPGVSIDGTMEFSGASGATPKLSKVAVTKSSPAGPAVLVTGAAGLELEDAVVFSRDGDGVFISAGTTNKIVRTLAVTGGAVASAVRVDSTNGTPDKALTLDSTLLIGGGSGLGVFTFCAEIQPAAGNVSITARHITAAGSTHGVQLDSSAAATLNVAGPGRGNITMTMTDSIAFQNRTASFDGLLGGDNVATLTADPTRNMTSGDLGAIFADAPGRNFRLRPTSPAIDRGGFTAGESATDIDGEARPGPTTDFGADEYYNAAPVAKFAVKNATPRAAQPTVFDAGGSSDREGPIAQYQWSFSDGTTENSATPALAHVFAAEGDASATLVVVDGQGASSAPTTVAFKLIDGTPPIVAIVKPKNKQTIKRFTTKTTTKTVTVAGKKTKTTTKTRSRTKITFAGLSKDASGVTRILLTLEKLGAKTSSKCSWFDPAKGITRRACTNPVLLNGKLKAGSTSGEWTYRLKRNLNVGSYRLTAFGIDGAGAFGNSGGSKVGVVKFKVK